MLFYLCYPVQMGSPFNVKENVKNVILNILNVLYGVHFYVFHHK